MRVVSIFRRPTYDKSSTAGLARSSAFALASRLAPGLSTFVVNVAIGRLGGPMLLGLTQTVISSATIAALFYPTPAGANASRSISSFNAIGEHDNAKSISSYLASRVLIATIALSLAVMILTRTISAGTYEVTVVAGLFAISLSLRAFVEGLHFGGGESQRLAVWSTAIALLSSIGTILLLLSGVHSVWVLGPLVALNLTFVALSWPRKAKKLEDPAVKSGVSRFIRFAVIGTLSSAGFTQLGIILATTFNGLGYAGSYAAGTTLTAPLVMLSSALGSVLFPALATAHAQHNHHSLRGWLNGATSQLITLILAGCIPLTILAEPIVQLVWGDTFADASWILLFIIPAVAVNAISSPAVSAITSESNRGMAVSATASACGAAIGVVVWICTIPMAPEIGVPIGYLAGILVVATIPWTITWRRYKMRWSKNTIIIGSTLLTTTLVTVMLQQLQAPLYLCLISASIALALWLLVRRSTLRDSWRLFKNLRR